MKLTRMLTVSVKMPPPIEPWRVLRAWLPSLADRPGRHAPPQPADAVDFQDTQPSIHDAGATLS